MYEKHDKNAPNARVSWTTLTNFAKLNATVQEYIVKFTDATLIDFCIDLPKALGGGSNVKFIDYTNNTENLNVVKNFVGHKLNDTAFDLDYEKISEAEADKSLVGLAQDWVKRSAAWQKTQTYLQNGRDYGDHAAKNLLSPNSSLAESLAINMADYYLFREVYLYVDKAQDQYTKADILLVKYKSDKITIDNVILLETKLSGSTEYTPRQKQSYRIIENTSNKIGVFELKSPRNETRLLNGNIFTDNSGKQLNVSLISINKINAYKISDHGMKDGVLEKSNINTTQYATYIAPDNK